MDTVIADFCAEVASEPLCYFSEADLQGLLFQRLMAAFPPQVETAYARGPGAKGMYRTGLVHREYGATEGLRTDISVFAPADVARIDSPNLQTRGKYLPPCFAVELGTEKTIDTAAHIQNDLVKLERAKCRGYLVHFFRDVTRADVGTASRNRTEEKLDRIFRNHAAAIVAPANVKYLCFVLRIARSSKTIHGKCELLIPGSGMWRRTNLQQVREAVLELLNETPAV